MANQNQYVIFGNMLCKIVTISDNEDTLTVEQILKDGESDCIFTVPNLTGDGKDLPRGCGYDERVYEALNIIDISTPMKKIEEIADLFGIEAQDILDELSVDESEYLPF